jgi:hypothetical protein
MARPGPPSVSAAAWHAKVQICQFGVLSVAAAPGAEVVVLQSADVERSWPATREQRPAASPTGSATSAAPSPPTRGSSSTARRYGRPGREMSGSMTTQQPWPWPEEMDAPQAAPASHRVLLDNDQVRVLEVVIEPGTREPEHTHRAVSVMIVDEPARIRYYEGDALRFESPARSGSTPGVRVRWMEPEGPHSVENIDERRYHAIRVELK